MIENVGKDALNFQANALRYPEILPHAEVHIPIGQSRETAEAAVLVVQSENRVAEVVNRRWPGLEKIGKLAVWLRIGVTALGGCNGHRVFIAEVVHVIPGTILLTISGRGKEFD